MIELDRPYSIPGRRACHGALPCHSVRARICPCARHVGSTAAACSGDLVCLRGRWRLGLAAAASGPGRCHRRHLR
jgi:hypothetical protein